MTEPDWTLEGGIWTPAPPAPAEPPAHPAIEPTAEVDEEALSHLHLIFYGDLNLCGCGDPDEVWTLIHAVLTYASVGCNEAAWADLGTAIGSTAARHFVLSALDEADLTGHGMTFYSIWLTDKGKWLLWMLNSVGLEGLAAKVDEVGYPHYPDDCTEACWRMPGSTVDGEIP